MIIERHRWKYAKLIYIYPVAIGVLSIVTNYNRSHNPSLSDATRPSFAVLLSIIIPLIITWMLATFGTVRLKTYAHSIIDSKDGRSLNYIADSLLLLLAYIVMLPMINSLLSLVRHT